MSWLHSLFSLIIHVCTCLPTPLLTEVSWHCSMEVGEAVILTCWQQIILTLFLGLCFILSTSCLSASGPIKVLSHSNGVSINTFLSWGDWQHSSCKVFQSHVGGGRNKVEGEARCLISPLTSFISSPDVLQDVFLVLMAEVLQSSSKCGPQMC